MNQAGPVADQSGLRLPARAALFGVGYLALAWLGDLVSLSGSPFASFWLPSGLFVAVLLLNPTRAWSGWVAAALVANVAFDLAHGRSLDVCLLYFAGNGLEALIGAWLVRRFVGDPPGFSTLRQIVGFAGMSALLSPLVSASVGSAAVAAQGGGEISPVTWILWWSGDALGILLIAPLALTWISPRPLTPAASPARLLEAGVLGMGLAVTAGLAFGSLWRGQEPWYLTIPFVLWAALRFGPRGTSAANVLLAIVASWLTTHGGLLRGGVAARAAEQTLALQLFLAMTAFTTLVVAAILAQQRRADEALRASEERYRSMVENSHEVIGLLDREGQFLYASPSVLRITGHSPEEMLVPTTFGMRVHPDDLETVREALRRIVNNPRAQVALEYRLRHKDGSWRFLEAVGVNRLDDPNVGAIVANFRDITERKEAEQALKESEERFRTLIEGAPVAIGLARDGVTVYANRKYGELYGFPNLDELGGRPIVEQWAPQSRAELEERVRCRTLGMPVPIEYEGIGQRRDGSQFPVHSAAAAVQLADGPATIGFLSDITERKIAESLLKRSYDELRALDARMETVREEESTRIAREVHDQVGQALTVLKMDIAEVRRALGEAGPVPAPAAERLAAMGQVLDRTLDVVHRISTELRPGVLDTLGLASAVEWQLEEFRKRTGVDFRFTESLGDTEVETARATAVFRILQELLTNITRHADARNVEVRLAVIERLLSLEVRDDGRGIEEHEIEAPRSFGLLGIRERAAHVGGTVLIRGKPGKGTVVNVSIPL